MRKGNAGSRSIAKVKLLRERSRKLIVFLHDMLANFCQTLEQEGLDACIHDCNLLCGHPNFPKNPRKIRERAAKKCNGPSPPIPLQSLHAQGHTFVAKTQCFLSFLFLSSSSPSPLFFPFPIYIRFLLFRWADEVLGSAALLISSCNGCLGYKSCNKPDKSCNKSSK